MRTKASPRYDLPPLPHLLLSCTHAQVMRAQMRMVGARAIGTALGFYALAVVLQFAPIAILNVLVRHLSGTGYPGLTPRDLGLMTAALLVLPVVAAIAQVKRHARLGAGRAYRARLDWA